MKKIKNAGIQAVQICLKTPKGPEFVNLKPNTSIVVSESSLSSQVKTLAKRRRIQVSNI